MERNTKKKLVIIEIIILILAVIFVGIIIMEKTDVISISDNPPSATIYTDITTGKIPLEVLFSGIGEDDKEIVSYYWEFGDGTVSDQQYPIHTFRKDGRYIVCLTVKDNNDNTARDTIIIEAVENKPPTAKITASEERGYAPIRINFKAEGSDEDGEIISYYWEFHDKSTDLQNPSKIYWTPGTYTVKLVITDDNGAKGEDTKEIEVEEHTLVKFAKFYISWKIFKWLISL